MKKCTIAAMATIPLLAACYPMEQAPLVYASKATIGVNITGGTTDNPGVDLVLGYKASDIALVPVAVAKHCPYASVSACTHDIYKTQVIAGTKNDKSSSANLQLQIAKAESAVAEASNRVLELQNQKTNLQTQKTESIRRDGIRSQKETFEASPPVDGEDRAARLADFNAQINAFGPLSETAALTKEIDTKESEIITATGTLDSAKISLASLKAQLRSEVSADRGDSLSVYGTFGGTGNAQPGQGGSSGGISGEKIFATGIAAQNLSDYRGATDCLTEVRLLAREIKGDGTPASDAAATSDRNALLADATKVCKSQSDKQDGS